MKIFFFGLLVAVWLAPSPARASSAHHRPEYSARVEQQLDVMAAKMRRLEKRPVRGDLRPRIHEGLQTLRGKYESARIAFRNWRRAPAAQKPARRKDVDAALVDLQKFYTKVVNRFRG